MSTLWKDIRYSIRFFSKRPGFTFAVALVLGLGLGVNTVVFSIVNAVLFRPLPIKDPSRLVVLASKFQNSEFPSYVSYQDYLDYKDHTELVSDLIAFMNKSVNFSTTGSAVRIPVELVTGNYFTMLGVDSQYGRTILPDDAATPGGGPVIVLSNSFWKRQFNSDPSVIGQSVHLDGYPFTVIGVLPESFLGTEWALRVDGYVPVTMNDQVWAANGLLTMRDYRALRVMGNLKPGVKLGEANAGVKVVAQQLEQRYPETNKGTSAFVVKETSARPDISVAGFLPTAASVFMAFVALVLLIACINVANLLIARTKEREREIGIRIALGAGRARVVRQLLTETILLSLCGAALGVVLGIWASHLLSAIKLPSDAPIRFDVTADWSVVLFGSVLAVLAGVICGIVPALQVSNIDLEKSLKEGTRGLSGGRRHHYLTNILVVAQVSVSLILLICAGLFLKSLQKTEAANLGFRRKNVLLMSVDVGQQKYDQTRGEVFYKQLVDRVSVLPGVKSASLSYLYPFSTTGNISLRVEREGNLSAENKTVRVFCNYVGTGLFETMDIGLVRGRVFTDQDNQTSPKVVIVNETMADHFWPNKDPIGQTVKLAGATPTTLEVVGVAKDGKYITPTESPRSFMYMPLLQNYQTPVTLNVYTAGEPAGLTLPIRDVIRSMDVNLPVYDIITMDANLSEGLAFLPIRLAATFVGFFGLLGLVLTIAGVSGIVSHSASQRVREIGIRMALGATPRDILRLITWRGLMLTIVGLVIGLAASLSVTRLLSSLLYGISTTDQTAFAGAMFVLLLVSFLACYIPARRAARVDPMEVLRYE
jgi:predicted permease